MMKIYIVTSGSYSDYHINKVFLDRTKAKQYAKGVYDVNDIEEWETEDRQAELFYSVTANAEFVNDEICDPLVRDSGYNFYINVNNSLDYQREDRNWYSETPGYISCVGNKIIPTHDNLSITRYFDHITDKVELKEKFKKIILDLYAQIKALKSEGWTVKMIQEWLNNK